MYKTPSPVTAKRRLSDIPVTRTGVGRTDRIASEHARRVQTEWPELQNGRNRRGSLGTKSELVRELNEETESVDSTMGFRELERVI